MSTCNAISVALSGKLSWFLFSLFASFCVIVNTFNYWV
uniref:Uncharacterized protein n=1 Tax=Rhizophora mucronata TaxID=61149 RepID=A0A2P2PW59_RHIMU